MRLLERDQPLDVLTGRAAGAAAGQGTLVLVTGEAGIGKTALLRRFAERIRPELDPLWGLCDPLSTPRPLGPLRDVAGDLDDGLATLLRDPGTAPYEIFAAVHDALRRRPRVLIVEDLHWADEATLDLVRFLTRRLATLPLLLVVSYRDTVDADHPLRPVLGDLVRSPDIRRLPLAPLSVAAVAELLDTGSDGVRAGPDGGHAGPDPRDVHRRTAGNPFFVAQIAAQPDAALPDSVRDAVVARTALLPAPDRAWLELLSCAPEGVSGRLLAALEVPSEVVGTLIATGLLERHAAGVAFRHEIARTAVLEAAAPGAAALHRRMIEVLEGIGGEASVLTHHAAAAGDVERILRHAPVAAADAARSGAHREALACYELALSQVAGDDLSTRAELLEGLSDELYVSDRLADAVEARTRALALRRELADPVALGVGHRALSALGWYAADRAFAEHHDRESVRLLAGAGDRADQRRELGYALANRAYLAAQRGEAEEALRNGDLAREIADELGDDGLRATAAVPVAVTRVLRGELAARDDLLAASATGLREGMTELATGAMSNLGHLDVEQGRLAEADAVLADALTVSDERGIRICSAWHRGTQARLRLLQGRWADAERDARTVLDSGGNLPLGRLWPHLVLGLLEVRRDAPEDNPHLDELWRLALRLDQPGKFAPAVAALAEQAWVLRRPDPRLDRSPAVDLAGWSFTGRDQALERARAWARRLAADGVQDLGPLAGPGPAGVTEPGPAGVAEPGPAGVTESGRYERAMTAWDVGDPAGLSAAVADLDELGARAVAARFRARLRELGVPVPRAPVPRAPVAGTRANPAGLTARQLDVLSLLVDGLSNAEIATRLVISPKTADHHVSAILAKLDVRSRGEAAALARRLGV